MIELRDNEKEYIKNKKGLLEKNNLKQFFSSIPSNCGNIAPMLIMNGFNVFKYIDNITHRMFSGSTIDTFEIPEGVEIIGKSAFENCLDLKSVVIPDTVKKIQDNAFINCPKLRKLIIPDSVVSLGKHVFDDGIKLATPKRTLKNKLQLPKNELDWYKNHLVILKNTEEEE